MPDECPTYPPPGRVALQNWCFGLPVSYRVRLNANTALRAFGRVSYRLADL